MERIGLGGSCHWCTEAIFQSLKGVSNVDQGWISSKKFPEFSEAVLIDFDPQLISLQTLIQIHLHTHSCTSTHPLRSKYRSAIYYLHPAQKVKSEKAMRNLTAEFEQEIITEILIAQEFKLNKKDYLNYYYDNPSKPFCENIINPKLRLLIERFSAHVNKSKLKLR